MALPGEWIKENAADDLDSPTLKPVPTLPFSKEEMERILKAAAKIDGRLHAFILVTRHSGLRISDTTVLSVSALQDDKIRLYQEKTGEYVFVVVPDEVVKALRVLPHKNPEYFFWSGKSKVQAAASV